MTASSTTRPLRGLEELQARLERAATDARLHHALLLTGPRGVGKATLATALARGALCAAEEASAFGCGRCGPCGRVDRGQHPDLRIVQRPEGKARIPVEMLRELVAELGRGSLEGRGRVAILVRADRMQREGQNALLKTLEEPEGGARLILTAERPEALLDTVRSRCERVAVPPLSLAELRSILSQEGLANDAERLAGLAQGSLGLARSLGSEGLLGLESLCKPLLDPSARRGMSPQSFASRVLEGVESAGDGGGIRQAKIERARAILLLATRFVREEALRELGVLAGGSAAASCARGDGAWGAIEASLAGLADLDSGIGAELVLASVFQDCAAH